ncbi:hypothetical protein [Massilia sp. ST3]|uniref:hypothetical protein n=1 Tax=Massilia sp. ST3 TaxID=2824903 RepID=UPI001B83CD63|nr:hypothetical protein [Massilia sp. ST3]MBQ5947567.1 hypothetical protein [Massilia sp. ST3]
MLYSDRTVFEAHVYLDHHYPPVIWNIARGGFDSADMFSDEVDGFVVSTALASMLRNSSADRIRAEFELERVRKQVAPHEVSRLRGLFVFDELESIAQLWEIDKWGGHFQCEYMADVGVSARKTSRVDANWIDEIIAGDGSLRPDWERAARQYWLGLPYPKHPPMWERIVEGTFTVWSTHSRREALKEIEAIWPSSTGLLCHSMNCHAAGSRDGQVVAGLTIREDTLELDCYLRMVDSMKPELAKRLSDLKTHRPRLFAGVPDIKRFSLPDLSGFCHRIPMR